MTTREMLIAVISGKINDEVVAKAQEIIAKQDESAAKRKSKPSKKSIENAPIKDAILAVMTNEFAVISEIAERVTGYEVSTSKANALLRQLAAEGKVEVTDVKVPSVGTRKAYRLVVAE